MDKPGNREIRPLTSIRGIAALLVFLHHFTGVTYPSYGKNLVEAIWIEGHLGVNMFFVLSGFLISLRYYEGIAKGTQSLGDYFIKRVARIYPLYYVLFAAHFYLGLTKTAITIPWTNLTLTHAYFRRLRFSGVPTAWSLTVEETFYLLAPLIFIAIAALLRTRWFSRRGEIVATVITVVALSLGLYGIGSSFEVLIPRELMVQYWNLLRGWDFVSNYTIFGLFFDFGVGLIGAAVYRAGWVDKLWALPRSAIWADAITIGSIIAMTGTIWLLNGSGGFLTITGYLIDRWFSILAGLWIISLTNSDSVSARILDHELPVYLGRISYALYLVQFFVNDFVLNGLELANSILMVPVRYIVTGVISAGLYELVEKPGRSLVLWLSVQIVNLKYWFIPASAVK